MSNEKELKGKLAFRKLLKYIGIAVATIVILSAFLNGCGKKRYPSADHHNSDGTTAVSNTTAATTSAAVDQELIHAKTYIDALLTAGAPVVEGTGRAALGVQVAELIFQNMQYEITNMTDTECTAVVTAPDMKVLFYKVSPPEQDTPAASLDEHESTVVQTLNMLAEKLQNGEFEKITTTVTLPLDENGNPQPTYELTDAMYGGLLTLTAELTKAAIQSEG